MRLITLELAETCLQVTSDVKRKLDQFCEQSYTVMIKHDEVRPEAV